MTNDCSGGGVQRFIRIAKQTTFDVEGITFKYQGLAQNPTDTINQETFESRGTENVNATQVSAGVRTSVTSCDFDYQIGRIFALQFGGTVTHNVTTGDVVHTFDVNSAPPYLTIVVGNDASTVAGTKHKNQICDTMNISYELNGNVQVSISTTGNYVEGVTVKPAHTVPTTQVLTYRHSGMKINGVAVKRVQSASINITGTVENVAGSESQDSSCTVFLGREVEFTVNAAMNTLDYRNHIKNNDVTIVEMLVDNGVALGSGKRGFEVELGKLAISSLEEAGSVGSITTFTITGTGVIVDLEATDSILSADF